VFALLVNDGIALRLVHSCKALYTALKDVRFSTMKKEEGKHGRGGEGRA